VKQVFTFCVSIDGKKFAIVMPFRFDNNNTEKQFYAAMVCPRSGKSVRG
jgi:hypothetical protein